LLPEIKLFHNPSVTSLRSRDAKFAKKYPVMNLSDSLSSCPRDGFQEPKFFLRPNRST